MSYAASPGLTMHRTHTHFATGKAFSEVTMTQMTKKNYLKFQHRRCVGGKPALKMPWVDFRNVRLILRIVDFVPDLWEIILL